jgi:hypothetical protein
VEAIGDAIESHSRPSFGWNIHRTGTDGLNGTTIQRFKQRFRHPAAVGVVEGVARQGGASDGVNS